jgi:drug/metabolite transporter (DMT)-like permease
MTSHHQDHALKGALYMMLSMLTFCVVNVVVKDTAGHYPILQLVFFRNVFALLPCYLILRGAGGVNLLRTPQVPSHVLCGTLGVLALFCLFTSFRELPLADATVYCYTSIFFVTLFSILILKERVSLPIWGAILVGFGGVVYMAKPSGDVFQSGIFYSLTFSCIDAFVLVSARRLTKKDHPAAVVFYFSLVASVVSACFLPFGFWKTPSTQDFAKLVFLGLGGGLGQFLLARACTHAPAVVVAPLTYTSLVWSVLFGWLFWSDFPAPHLWIGCAVVMGCGLFIIMREHAQQKKAASLPDQEPADPLSRRAA